MAENNPIHRIYCEAAEIAAQTAFVREIVARSAQVLKAPLPDTFLGRKTHEPFEEQRE
jgi:hypothetical protein